MVFCCRDGEPTGESPGQVRSTIARTKDALRSSPYGAGACAYQFAQVTLTATFKAVAARRYCPARWFWPGVMGIGEQLSKMAHGSIVRDGTQSALGGEQNNPK